jgi:uncharacterized membrane protein
LSKTRLEAFSDGVIAIIITIMVLELRPPHDGDVSALRELIPHFVSYVMSFVFVGIYWSNHHHMFHAVEHVGGSVLWANLHLLFWLSLTPFVTAWMGDTHFASWPVAAYGVVLLMDSFAYMILEKTLLSLHGTASKLAKAFGRRVKEWVSMVAYLAAIPVAFVEPRISGLLYVVVALTWIVPDRRIEKVVAPGAS